MSDRQQKVQQELQAHIATFIQHEANTNPLITVTHVDISPEFKNATVYFTTIPAEKENDALIFLKREGTALRTYVKNHMRIKQIPHFSFSVDYGERHRQHIDELVRKTGTQASDYLPSSEI
jgi:ribosome-binding factor A